MSSSSGKELAFYHFLCSAFDPEGLRTWVYFGVSKEACDALPSPPANIQNLAFHALQLIEQRGRFNEELFTSLLSMREKRAPEIQALARRWDINIRTDGTALSAVGPPHGPGTGAVPSAAPQRDPAGSPRTAPSPGARAASAGPARADGTGTSAGGRGQTRARGRKRLSSTAMLLDRTSQWEPVQRLCETADHPVGFIVHGPAGQDVELFCQRTQRYLHDECKRSHNVHRLKFDDDYCRANSTDHWLDRLRLAVGGGLNTVAQVRKAAKINALMLIIGEAPLWGLDGEETAALCEFLAVSLPKVIADAAAANPIRVLIPIEYAGPDVGLADPLVQAVHAALARAPGFKTELLVGLTFPPWPEVEAYLFKTLGTLDKAFLYKCSAAYESVAVQPDSERSFAELAEALNALLESRADPGGPRERQR